MNRFTPALRSTLAILALAFALAGCSSPPTKADKQPVEQDDPLDLDAPSPEELADSPCGNPDWSKLPSKPPAESSNP